MPVTTYIAGHYRYLYFNFILSTKAAQWFIIGKSTNLQVSSFQICDVIWENLSHAARYQTWVIGIIWKLKLSSFQNVLLELSVILVSKVTDVQRLSKKRKTLELCCEFPLICSFTLCDMLRFSENITDLSLYLANRIEWWSQIPHLHFQCTFRDAQILS